MTRGLDDILGLRPLHGSRARGESPRPHGPAAPLLSELALHALPGLSSEPRPGTGPLTLSTSLPVSSGCTHNTAHGAGTRAPAPLGVLPHSWCCRAACLRFPRHAGSWRGARPCSQPAPPRPADRPARTALASRGDIPPRALAPGGGSGGSRGKG